MIQVFERRLLRSANLLNLCMRQRTIAIVQSRHLSKGPDNDASKRPAPSSNEDTKQFRLELGKQRRDDIGQQQSANDKIAFTTVQGREIRPMGEKKPFQDALDYLKMLSSNNRFLKFMVARPVSILEWLQQPKQKKIDSGVRGIRNVLLWITASLFIHGIIITYRYQQHEVTGRPMVVILLESLTRKADAKLTNEIIEQFQGRFKTPEDKILKEMDDILAKLIKDNKEYINDERFDKRHVCSLIDVKVPQELILSSDQMLVFTTGLMELCENEHQRAYVIANSLAHYILKHSREPGSDLSFSQIVVRLKISYSLALWSLLSSSKWFNDNKYLGPIDKLDEATGNYFYRKYRKFSSELLYDKELEAEADRIALQMLARSCYDIRQVNKFTEKCVTLAENSSQPITSSPSLPIANYIYRNRFDSDKLSYLQSVMDKFLQFRNIECKCAPLTP